MGDAHTWKRTNRIMVGDSPKNVRFLPYLPLWWPLIVTDEGRAQEGRKRQKTLPEKDDDVIQMPAEVNPPVIEVPPPPPPLNNK
mmetsp:Transcript_18360/g.27983  ORF Transcript_18360/g.27983 Transcript_18360/m.27983 type:complete len:84 (+) Transcript_18360:3-254(+)